MSDQVMQDTQVLLPGLEADLRGLLSLQVIVVCAKAETAYVIFHDNQSTASIHALLRCKRSISRLSEPEREGV